MNLSNVRKEDWRRSPTSGDVVISPATVKKNGKKDKMKKNGKIIHEKITIKKTSK